MKKKGVLLSLVMVFLGGCASPSEVILVDGSVLQSIDKPRFDPESGFYQLTQADGRKITVNKNLVKAIKSNN